MRFDGVLFDMGDIFYDASEWRHWLTQELNDRGVSCTYEELVQRWERLLVDVYCGRADYWQRFATLLESFNLAANDRSDVTSSACAKASEVQQHRRLFDGVRETLSQLDEMGLRLGVLSDTESPGHRIRATLDSLEIGCHFAAVISSRDIGHAKPERAAFEAAILAMGISREACAFVGHEAEELDGARNSGLYTIAFNASTDAKADTYLKKFADLTTIVSMSTLPAT